MVSSYIKKWRVLGVVLTLALGALLMYCSLGTLSSHYSKANTSASAVSCNGSCDTHTQPTLANRSTDPKEKDDIEPGPPAFVSLIVSVPLAALYLAPFAVVVWYLLWQRKLFLSTHLRF